MSVLKKYGVETVCWMVTERPVRSFRLADTKPCFGACPLSYRQEKDYLYPPFMR